MNAVSQTRKGQKGRWLRVSPLTPRAGVEILAIRTLLECLRQHAQAEGSGDRLKVCRLYRMGHALWEQIPLKM